MATINTGTSGPVCRTIAPFCRPTAGTGRISSRLASGTNVVAQGQSNTVAFYYQWGRTATSQATLSVWLDDDFNPWNGNERLVGQVIAPVTGTDQIGYGTAEIDLGPSN